jgi:nitrite reductase/ring-hydroxylating ferredoxin subunit
MTEVGTLRATDLSIHLDRRAAHYADAFMLARHLLRSVGRALSAGDVTVGTFLIRTPELVEAGLRCVVKRDILVLARAEKGYVAFEDRCTHSGGSLAGGVMMCGTVQCLWHGSQFNVSTGKVKAGPAKKEISVYR